METSLRDERIVKMSEPTEIAKLTCLIKEETTAAFIKI